MASGSSAAKSPMTPIAAVLGGVMAGIAGTVCLDAVQYLRYRLAGGKKPALEWEIAPVSTWEEAPDPGKFTKQVIEGLTRRELPDSWAWPVSTATHWGYGAFSGALYGILAGSVREPHPVYGLPFGIAVWGSGYVVLPQAGIYKPIWEYDAKTLARDLSGHLAYGAGTGAAFWLFAKL